MVHAQVVHAHARAQRKSVPAQGEPERDRKRSAPPALTVVDECVRTSSRRSSRLEASPAPRKLRPPATASGGFLNASYVGSVTSVASAVGSAHNNTVMREQYCSCARWSRLEQLLLVAVGVLAGIVAGLVVVVSLMALRGDDVPPSILRRATTTPFTLAGNS